MNMRASDIVELEESVQGGFFRMKYPWEWEPVISGIRFSRIRKRS